MHTKLPLAEVEIVMSSVRLSQMCLAEATYSSYGADSLHMLPEKMVHLDQLCPDEQF